MLLEITAHCGSLKLQNELTGDNETQHVVIVIEIQAVTNASVYRYIKGGRDKYRCTRVQIVHGYIWRVGGTNKNCACMGISKFEY